MKGIQRIKDQWGGMITYRVYDGSSYKDFYCEADAEVYLLGESHEV